MKVSGILTLIPRKTSILKMRASMLVCILLFAILALLCYEAQKTGFTQLREPIAIIAILIAVFIYIVFQELRCTRLDGIVRNLLREISLEGDQLKLPRGTHVKLVELELLKYLTTRGNLRSSVTYKTMKNLNDNVANLNLAREGSYTFAATVSIHRGTKITVNPDKPFETGVGSIVKDRFIYIGLAFHFTYMGREFLAVPLLPSTFKVEKNLLRVRHCRDYAEATIRTDYDELHTSITYRRDKSRSVKLILSPIEEVHLRSSFHDITLIELNETSSSAETVKLPTLKETHILIVPVDEMYIASRVLPIDKIVFHNRKSYKTLISGYGESILKLILDLPMKKDVVDYSTLITAYEA